MYRKQNGSCFVNEKGMKNIGLNILGLLQWVKVHRVGFPKNSLLNSNRLNPIF
ncbi:hypothetical protein [Leptospira interrogans]|uniref:hypothetical protein n=1 Tax=Leptospira interrogans TaxID=173 RepID=UPI000A9BC8B8|nr:hypothetical protein [Leptospira interrogans]